MEARIAYYHWMDFYTKIWHSSKCEVLEEGNRTYRIKLLECARGGARPGTSLTVQKKSVTMNKANAENDSWKIYSYFE
jgi:hypothetical protein